MGFLACRTEPSGQTRSGAASSLQGVGLRAWSLGSRVSGAGCRVKGLGPDPVSWKLLEAPRAPKPQTLTTAPPSLKCISRKAVPRSQRVPKVDSICRLLIVPLFRGSSRFESLILSQHFRRVTCECDEEDVNDDDDDESRSRKPSW